MWKIKVNEKDTNEDTFWHRQNVIVEVTIKQLREKIKDLEDKTESTIQVNW